MQQPRARWIDVVPRSTPCCTPPTLAALDEIALDVDFDREDDNSAWSRSLAAAVGPNIEIVPPSRVRPTWLAPWGVRGSR
jgi:hypothetical protein